MPATIYELDPTATPTGKSIKHRGRTFAIYTTKDDRADSPYVLVPESGRGTAYALTRNIPNPNQLFGIQLDGPTKVLPGWFSDKTGELVSLG